MGEKKIPARREAGPLPQEKPRFSYSKIDAFLEQTHARDPPQTTGRGRLVFALDATMSRQPTWDSACAIQGDMFDVTPSIGGLDVWLVYFAGLANAGQANGREMRRNSDR